MEQKWPPGQMFDTPDIEQEVTNYIWHLGGRTLK